MLSSRLLLYEEPHVTARRLLESSQTLILDTETTGLGPEARVIELAVIDTSGAVLLDTLIQPGVPVPPEATAIHGLTDDDLLGAPSLVDVWPGLANATIVAYNAEFDARLLAQSAPEGTPPLGAEWVCAMHLWSRHLRQVRWMGLAAACRAAGVIQQEPVHRALGDARTTLALLRAVADSAEEGKD